jgi:hypothetical protein
MQKQNMNERVINSGAIANGIILFCMIIIMIVMFITLYMLGRT